MAVAAAEHTDTPQMGLYRTPRAGSPAALAGAAAPAGLCAGCRQREARYGFRGRRGAGRPGTLCFQCFRSELGRRQDIAERKRRGWNAVQAGLPLAETIEALHTRRRHAQIAARHALDGTTPAAKLREANPQARGTSPHPRGTSPHPRGTSPHPRGANLQVGLPTPA